MTRDDLEFLRRFERQRLSESEWTHEAHVRVAWILLTLCGPDAGEQRLRRGIQDHNRVVLGRPDRYHETVTLAFARIIAARLLPGETYGEFVDRCPDLLSRDAPHLLSYYSPDQLFSERARGEFVTPDLAALPQPSTVGGR